MQIRAVKDSDYNNIRALWDECFPEDSMAWRDWYFKYIYKPDNVFALFEDSIPVSMAHINEYPLVMNSKMIKAFALAGVSTSSRFRHRGFADIIIRKSIKEMHKRGAAFSFLYPFNYDFYIPYGFAESYTTSYIEQEPGPLIDGYTAGSYLINDIVRLYEEYAGSFNGYVARDNKYTSIKMIEYIGDHYDIQVIKYNGLPVAYYAGKEDVSYYRLDEFICTGNEQLILRQIANSKNRKVKAAIHHGNNYSGNSMPYCMGRIINFKLLFEGINCNKCNFKLHIVDDIIIENSGVWDVYELNGRLMIEKSSGSWDIEIKINDLAPVATGSVDYMTKDAKQFNNLIFGDNKRSPWIIEVC